jgi:hypothetical protein
VREVGAQRLLPVTRRELPRGSSALQVKCKRTTRPFGIIMEVGRGGRSMFAEKCFALENFAVLRPL